VRWLRLPERVSASHFWVLRWLPPQCCALLGSSCFSSEPQHTMMDSAFGHKRVSLPTPAPDISEASERSDLRTASPRLSDW
jgi:hypothetical protein